MDVEIRPLEFERRNDFRQALAFAFHWDEGLLGPDPDPDFDALHEADRTRGAFDGDDVVGTLTAFTLELSVPGGNRLRTAGTTGVSVRPTHRRRGLLRRLMASHFEEVRERGEPTASLWASESAIYRRFGYGVATFLSSERIDRGDTDFIQPTRSPGSCRMIDSQEALRLLPAIYDRVLAERPGMMARSDAWWRHRVLRDASYDRDGGTPYRRVVYEEDGEARGYLLYRTKSGRTPSVVVGELMGMDPAATNPLYEIACGVDFVDRVEFPNSPVDGPLPLLLADSREVSRRVRDALWVRLIDIPAALSGRSYAGEGRVRFAVSDDCLPDNVGCYELDASGGGATCGRVSAHDDAIALDVADLGAAFLGGTSLRNLARAGRALGSAQALTAADTLFSWDPQPWNAELF